MSDNAAIETEFFGMRDIVKDADLLHMMMSTALFVREKI